MRVEPRGSACRVPSAGTATPDSSNQFPQLCSDVPHPRWVHQPLPFAPWPWQPAQVPVEVSPGQQGVAGRMGLGWEGGVGSGFIRQPGVGARAPAAMRYLPGECGPATPPSESHELPGAPSKPVAPLPAGWPPTLPPLRGWHLGARQLVVATPALLEKHKLSGSLKQACCCPTKQLASQPTS